ncbi:MAG: VanZ family protein [Desulforegulaceae bacterium]|nr:VanZ family protein [Desulforegulaceae bacterium]
MKLTDKQKQGLLFGYICVITFLSIIPGGKSSEIAIPGMDKLVHFVFYLVLAVLFFYSEIFKKFRAEFLIILFCSSFFGVFIECIQAIIPWRSFELKDMIANFLGALSGLTGIFYLKKDSFK